MMKGRKNLLDYCQTCGHHTIFGCIENGERKDDQKRADAYTIPLDQIEKFLEDRNGISREGIFDFLYPAGGKGRRPRFKGSTGIRRQITEYMNTHPEWYLDVNVHNKYWRRIKKTISQGINNIVV